MLPGEIACKEILSLQYWKNADRVTACQQLLQFIDEYETWKKRKEAEIPEGSDFSQAYRELMSRIETCINRLKNGAAVLQENDKAWKSFVLMNEAMLLQRINTKGAKPETISWYPFQLAYILQIVPDIVNPDSEYRNYTDLLWFPTGGGKTEAYLGVAAFTIFFRRMVDTAFDDGVSVIMRYTLRLLTIQQFERAAALICACEFLRKQYGINGGEISIGLWIGSGMTPNSIDKAAEVLDDLKQDRDKKIYEGNPVQITKCPWCGSEIDITGYSIENRRLNIRCSDNSECPFHHHLPVYVVDEDIYARRPTLLLSTIDKFARIAWEDKVGKSFYQYVEATSVTPFSAKALEKALHCIFVAMVRHSIPQYSGNNGAAWFRSQNNQVKNICSFIANRVQMIHPKASAKTNNTLKDICMTWDYMSRTYPDLCYKADIHGGTPLLISAEGYAGDFDFPPAINSLRNVEPSSNIYFED